MSAAVIFVMTCGSAVTWSVSRFLLEPQGVFGVDLTYLQTIVFILVIAAFVQVVEIFLRKFSPQLYQALGIFLPLITTNCAVLGVAVLNIQKQYNLMESVVFGFGGAVGFSLALLIFTGLREKIERAQPPKAFRGPALALVTAGLLSLAFMGFAALIKM
jgi:electron transport complex protein RnfA